MEEEYDLPDVQAKWLSIAKVHTSKGFSPSALYANMRSEWNPVKDVRWRLVDTNLFMV